MGPGVLGYLIGLASGVLLLAGALLIYTDRPRRGDRR
ncbi:hypothetical protein Krad_1767 [Kineococcus radiotolerans SRS30216 = ATCC BAA-149]|uniref:Uncharacterized protein n=1 Tax=Kineococcus radiotolerans (strain ATCC BAA-149 / DSM 14245 / SRS30216) TaxID=266940 RepID=A6W8W4_KINRD|nr:hypothetical protein Krad_1767 [Kineococcus radiotolerans SRS30216 = ATCC BAA-149]